MHLVMDNHATHKTPAIQRWLVRHPRYRVHFMPTSASWLNQVERFFSERTEKQIRRDSFRSTQQLETAIRQYLDHHHTQPKPFRWTKSADDILTALANIANELTTHHTRNLLKKPTARRSVQKSSHEDTQGAIRRRLVDKSTGVSSDQTVILSSFESASAYPDPLRRVSYHDPVTGKRLKFLTHTFTLPALTIAHIYQQRWQVELFFKWIKQHLRIKAFFGASENAAKTQLWIAISVDVLVALVRKRRTLEASLYQILQILSVIPFKKTPLVQALQPSNSPPDLDASFNQLILFHV